MNFPQGDEGAAASWSPHPYPAQLRESVQTYLAAGFMPVPLPARSKAVKIKGWKERTFDVADFKSDANVAIRHDGGLVDVDLDWAEARALANALLPVSACFGRKSASPSHILYDCSELTKTIKFSLPASVSDDPRFSTGDHELTVLEVRAGQSTMAPPSIHPSGEQLAWLDFSGREIPLEDVCIVDAQSEELKRRCGLLAFLCVVVRCYPGAGIRNEVGLALSGTLVRAGYEPDEANQLTRLSAEVAGDDEALTRGDGHAARKRLDAGQDVAGLPRLVELLALPGEVATTLAKWLGDNGPSATAIILDNDREPENLDRIDAAFAGSTLPHFQRQGRRVHVTRNANADNERPGALVIRDASRRVIQQDAQRLLSFVKFDGRRGAFAPAQCPDRLAEMYLVKSDGWRVPELRGVRESPTLRADGTVLQSAGYDPGTGYLYQPQADYPLVPEHPTFEDAQAALAELLDVVRDFEFASEADRSVWLAAVLTDAIRPALASAPVFGFDAPQFGAGKTLLANLASMIVHGVPLIGKGWTASEEENEKRLYSALLTGEHSYLADNLKKGLPFGGEAIAAILTMDQWAARRLGKSEQTPVSTRATFFVTGVNLTFTADLVRRALKCRIEPHTERPENRAFGYDVAAETIANHPRLLTAALTVVRAYAVAGYPMQGKFKPMGSFGDFDRLVRGPLIALGCADPLETQRDIESVDPEIDALARGLELLDAVFGSRAFQVKDIATLAVGRLSANDAARALLDWVRENTAPARDGGAINTKSLGKFIASKRGTPRGGRMLKHVEPNTREAEGKLGRDGPIWKVIPGPS